MKIRADIVALIRAGLTDESVARRVGCHRSTVNRARRALDLPGAIPRGRIYAEDVPTGLPPAYRTPTAPAQQAANRAALLAALRAA